MTVPAGVRAACAGEAAQNVPAASIAAATWRRRRRDARFAEPQMVINLNSLIDGTFQGPIYRREG